jgi:hypothetical protein
MRRLITLVIIGIGIVIAIYHFRKKENRSGHKHADAPASFNRMQWKDDRIMMLLPLPALIMPFLDK